MKLFSKRSNLEPIKIEIQIDSMDADLKNSLWSALMFVPLVNLNAGRIYLENFENLDSIVRKLWLNYFKKPIDTIPTYTNEAYDTLRHYFFSCEWNKVYDFIEFIANYYNNEIATKRFTSLCNTFLEREMSGYRFINNMITRITSEEEINEIEEALESTQEKKTIYTHLKKSLELLTDRKKPDYRNSIKESISAIEAICKDITKEPKATLGSALKTIESKSEIEIHKALKKSFESLYGYTSDADGIRHALLEEDNLEFEDAKLMLVTCSAFINYLQVKHLKM